MAINIKKLRSLTAEYEQAENRVTKIEAFINDLEANKSVISGIYVNGPEGVVEITDGIDNDFINKVYLMPLINGLYDEKDIHQKSMKELMRDIKKELQEEPTEFK